MRMRKLGLIIALSGTSLYACGEDSASDDKAINVPVPDAGGIDAGPVAATDAGRSDAAAPASDAGRAVADAAATDAAVRVDGGSTGTPPATDSGVARADSGTPVVDSGISGNTGVPATGDPRSAACLTCETEQCKASKWPESEQIFKSCSDFGSAMATDGMGKGMPKQKLCEDLLTCMRTTRCAAPQIPLADGSVPTPEWTACLTGDVPYDQALLLQKLSDFKGPCRDQFADAAETVNVMTLIERSLNPEFAVGAATTRALCQQRLCADECFATCKSQADGTQCSGLAPVDGMASGAGPSLGKQGTCQAQSCQDQLVPFYQSM